MSSPGQITRAAAGLIVAWSLVLVSCGAPSKVNVELRKKNQGLEDEVAKLKQDLAASQARVEGLESKIGTTPTLPQSRLDQMYTVHSIRLARLTGGADLDPNKPGDEGVRVNLEPLDESGDAIKATGTVTVEAVDMKTDPPQVVGRWQFTPQQLKGTWRSLGPIHEFVLECPWQRVVPAHPELALNVSFTDDLTGRTFSKLEQIKIALPPTTQPSTR
jgi:hypothetical protein